MAFTWNPIYLLNLVLCSIIFILGYSGYKKSKNEVAFYIAIAFGIFAISHLMGLLGAGKSLEGILIAIRILAYLIVIFCLYKVAVKR